MARWSRAFVRHWLIFVVAVGVGGVLCVPFVWRVDSIAGVVRGADGRPLAGATVRVKATDVAVVTDAEGRFRLAGFPPAFRVSVTGWAAGHYVSGVRASPWRRRFDLRLTPYTAADNEAYVWVPPAVEARSRVGEWWTRALLDVSALAALEGEIPPVADSLDLGCRDCHGRTIVDQWQASAHADGSRNPRFMTLYAGTDVAGNVSPPTRYKTAREYGTFPLRPDPRQPYYGPGYRLDFPDSAGNCAACHLPTAALGDPYGADPRRVSALEGQGSHCDFCHKIAAVRLDPATGLPFEDRPGVLSIELMRPGPGSQIFFGPYDDVDAGPDTYLPLMRQSEICAPCHQASFWGVPIYESFGEWLASPYPAAGKTCQSCHMEPDGVVTNFAPGRGGVERDPATVPTHDFPGAADRELLRNAVTMKVVASRVPGAGSSGIGESGTGPVGAVSVRVEITNDRTGHSVPTDSPLRHLLLLVRASDAGDRELELLAGPTVPAWGGRGDPERGYYADLPGKAFAKVLEELWTGVAPTAAYWNPTRLVSDNRLAPFATDVSSYLFATDGDGPVRVEVRLIFRRAFIELMDEKGWDVPDIVMAERLLTVAAGHEV
jgi:hypothetical protein